MYLVAVCSCPVGIAHTYMAAANLKKAAQKKGIEIKVETQGAQGVEDEITAEDIAALGEGGLCLNCPVCTYPNCGFGKGW